MLPISFVSGFVPKMRWIAVVSVGEIAALDIRFTYCIDNWTELAMKKLINHEKSPAIVACARGGLVVPELFRAKEVLGFGLGARP